MPLRLPRRTISEHVDRGPAHARSRGTKRKAAFCRISDLVLVRSSSAPDTLGTSALRAMTRVRDIGIGLGATGVGHAHEILGVDLLDPYYG
jgi:hypothetical protein